MTKSAVTGSPSGEVARLVLQPLIPASVRAFSSSSRLTLLTAPSSWMNRLRLTGASPAASTAFMFTEIMPASATTVTGVLLVRNATAPRVAAGSLLAEFREARGLRPGQPFSGHLKTACEYPGVELLYRYVYPDPGVVAGAADLAASQAAELT